MQKPALKTGLPFVIFLFISHQATLGNSLAQIGLHALRDANANLLGSGVRVAQVEVPETASQWQVNPATVSQPQSKFRWISSGGIATSFPNALGTESGHANGVAAPFFGVSSGVAPGVVQIDNYEVVHFINSVIEPAQQPSIAAKIVNQSFTYTTQNVTAEQKFDNYAATHNVLFVSGIGNGGAVLPPGTAYNGLGVAAFGGSSSVGPTQDGRCKPDITAPAGLTSFSTPLVSGAAAVLVQAGTEGTGGPNTNAATDIRTIKALLLNGAVKPSGWTNHPSKPLDLRYGSGVLNVFNSFKQLSFGKRSFVEATSHTRNAAHPPGSNLTNLSPIGWDLSTITNAGTGMNYQDRVHHYYFVVPTNGANHAFSATLTWNRAPGSSGINNLDLFLYNATSGSTIAVSTSTVDNVEHIYVPHLAPGRYNLQVWKSGTLLTSVETYALAYESVATDLQIQRSGSNVLVSWPTYPQGFGLEFTSSLNSPILWNPVNTAAAINDQRYQILFPANAPQEFYRLRRP